MNRYMMGVSELIEEECSIEMLVCGIGIAHLMVFAQKIEKSKHKKEKKRSRIDNDGPNAHGRSKNKKKFPDKFILMLLGLRRRGCLTLELKEREMSIHRLLTLGVARGMRVGLEGRDGFHRCGENVHTRKDLSKVKVHVREGNQVVASKVEDCPPKRNRFYFLQYKGYQK